MLRYLPPVRTLAAAATAVARLLLPAAAALLALLAAGAPVSAQPRASIVYDAASRTIELKGPGTTVRLTDVYNALRNDDLLQRVSPSQWLLKVNLRAFEQVRLELHGPAAGGDVAWLKLRSEPSGYATIEASNGQISIRRTRVTSWDTRAGAFDTAYLDGSGRAFIAAKNRTAKYTDNRMDVIDSEIAYLGFFEETAYGISWKVVAGPGADDQGILGKGMTGTVTGSRFHHNYFGVYVWGVGDMLFSENEFYGNHYYGFDAHTVAQRMTVEDNISRDNGGHGIILADRSTQNVIRRNTVRGNKGHGIMLHELSDRNLIEDNTVTGNDDGIPLFESSNNAVRHNVVRGNVTGVRVYGRASPSQENLFEDNEVSGSRSYGVFVYDAAEKNTFRGNRILSSRDAGVYLLGVSGNTFTGNTIRNNQYGLRLDSAEAAAPSSGNEVRDNAIQDNRLFGIYSYPPAGANALDGNRLSGNARDIVYAGTSPAPRERAKLGDALRLPLLAVIIAVAVLSALIAYLRRPRGRRG